MRDCRDGHPLSCSARLVVRWCPECARYEVRAWVAGDQEAVIEAITPEWATPQRFEDDEWLERNLTKIARRLAAVVRTMEDDERHGIARLPFS